MLLAALVNVEPWRGNVAREIDSTMREEGMRSFDIPWTSYAYTEDDPDHFCASHLSRFADDLSHQLRKSRCPSPALIVTDSTVGHYTDGADMVRQRCRDAGIQVVVDAVNGSGFVAGSPDHFVARLSVRRRAGERYASVVFMGGWNDASYHPRLVRAAVSRACSEAHRLVDFIPVESVRTHATR